MNKIEHSAATNILFKTGGTDFLKELFNSISFSEWNKRAKRASLNFKQWSYKDQYKMIGDLFEIFGEVFFKAFQCDNAIGIYDYHPIASNKDFGVDGIALAIQDAKPSAVQIKWRGDPTLELISEDLNQFVGHAVTSYSVTMDSKTPLVLFTNVKGLHWNTKNNVFNNKVHVINGEMIMVRVDDNKGFWEHFAQELINNTIISLFSVHKINS